MPAVFVFAANIEDKGTSLQNALCGSSRLVSGYHTRSKLSPTQNFANRDKFPVFLPLIVPSDFLNMKDTCDN